MFGAETRETMKTLHWTSRDLELLPEDGKRYEIIAGELYVAKQPDWEHLCCQDLAAKWNSFLAVLQDS